MHQIETLHEKVQVFVAAFNHLTMNWTIKIFPTKKRRTYSVQFMRLPCINFTDKYLLLLPIVSFFYNKCPISFHRSFLFQVFWIIGEHLLYHLSTNYTSNSPEEAPLISIDTDKWPLNVLAHKRFIGVKHTLFLRYSVNYRGSRRRILIWFIAWYLITSCLPWKLSIASRCEYFCMIYACV